MLMNAKNAWDATTSSNPALWSITPFVEANEIPQRRPGRRDVAASAGVSPAFFGVNVEYPF